MNALHTKTNVFLGSSDKFITIEEQFGFGTSKDESSDIKDPNSLTNEEVFQELQKLIESEVDINNSSLPDLGGASLNNRFISSTINYGSQCLIRNIRQGICYVKQ